MLWTRFEKSINGYKQQNKAVLIGLSVECPISGLEDKVEELNNLVKENVKLKRKSMTNEWNTQKLWNYNKKTKHTKSL